jgi:hypothetical protein
MVMAEGGIYLCEKKKFAGIYSLKLIDNPQIRAKGINLESCKEDICMQIIDWNGDGEAVLEFVPQKLYKRLATGTDMYRQIGYNDTVDLLNTNALYEGEICPKCKYALGKRTDETLDIEELPKGKKMVLGIKRKMPKHSNEFVRLFPVIEAYHKELVEVLDKDLFEMREILYKGKKSDYFELIPKKIIKNCSHKKAQYHKHPFLKNWRCTECGREELHFWTDQYKWENSLVNPADIEDLPSMFFLDTGLHISLCVRNDKWVEIGKNKKVVTNSVIVLDKEYVEIPEYFDESNNFDY